MAFGDAGGNLHIDLALTGVLAERDTALRSAEGLFHRDIHVAGGIITAWILTIPASALAAGIVFVLIRLMNPQA